MCLYVYVKFVFNDIETYKQISDYLSFKLYGK